ncbi:transcription initiation factor TFIID subunit 4-like [Sylvia atricapilla]|uniref:transcription initiation factor TFIID subunit 4-like n=1 Tax=Sylvia atricapilla TaxID=48155 RepID=UPI00339B1FB9
MAGGNRNTTGGRWRGPATTRRAVPRRGMERGAPPGRDGARRDAAVGPGRGRADAAPRPRQCPEAGAARAGPGAGAGRDWRRRPGRSGDGAIRAPRFAGGAPPAVRSRPGARCQRARANGRAAQHACCPPHGRPAPPRALKGPRPPRPAHVRAPRLRRGFPGTPRRHRQNRDKRPARGSGRGAIPAPGENLTLGGLQRHKETAAGTGCTQLQNTLLNCRGTGKGPAKVQRLRLRSPSAGLPFPGRCPPLPLSGAEPGALALPAAAGRGSPAQPHPAAIPGRDPAVIPQRSRRDPAVIPQRSQQQSRSDPAEIPGSDPAVIPAVIPGSDPAAIPQRYQQRSRRDPAAIPGSDPAEIPQRSRSDPSSNPAEIPQRSQQQSRSDPRSDPAEIPAAIPQRSRSDPAVIPQRSQQ